GDDQYLHFGRSHVHPSAFINFSAVLRTAVFHLFILEPLASHKLPITHYQSPVTTSKQPLRIPMQDVVAIIVADGRPQHRTDIVVMVKPWQIGAEDDAL